MQKDEQKRLTETANRLRRYREKAASADVLQAKLSALQETASACRRCSPGAAARAQLRAAYRRTEVQLRLQQVETRQIECALERLTPEERLILTDMLIRPVPMAADHLCEKLNVETATVYRRRQAALRKMAGLLGEKGSRNGTRG